MPSYKFITGKIIEFSATSYVELRETTSVPCGVCNLIYFTVAYRSISNPEIHRITLCICENLRFPGPFKNLRKLLLVGFTRDFFCSILYDDDREIFVLRNDGKHYRTKVVTGCTLLKGNPFAVRGGHPPHGGPPPPPPPIHHQMTAPHQMNGPPLPPPPPRPVASMPRLPRNNMLPSLSRQGIMQPNIIRPPPPNLVRPPPPPPTQNGQNLNQYQNIERKKN